MCAWHLKAIHAGGSTNALKGHEILDDRESAVSRASVASRRSQPAACGDATCRRYYRYCYHTVVEVVPASTIVHHPNCKAHYIRVEKPPTLRKRGCGGNVLMIEPYSLREAAKSTEYGLSPIAISKLYSLSSLVSKLSIQLSVVRDAGSRLKTILLL